jgi:hypothetical protein
MLLKRHCPHTGIMNFFSDSDPHLPVGMIYSTFAKHGLKSGFMWRCHAGDDSAAGRAADLKAAEASLVRYYKDHEYDVCSGRILATAH